MQIIRNFQNINQQLQGAVLTIGNFDGVHLGHQEILKEVGKIAKKENLKSALLTFEPHPIKIINPQIPCDIRLSGLSQKLHFLKNNNLVDLIFVSSFNREMANLSAEDFVKKILVEKLKVKHLVIGYDFIFGKNRLGNAELLEKLAKIHGFGFSKIDAKKTQNQNIYSSTKIRQFLTESDVGSANSMLGRNYQIEGRIIEGKKIARNLGFATANFLPRKNLIKPKFGVYKVNILLDGKKYLGVMNFGIKPTFSGTNPLFEVHIFNFNQNIYGKKIIVELLDFIRPEKKFNSIEELKKQIEKDCEIARIQ